MMKIAALLPHVEVFGGVRRYIEIGNEFTRRGHNFILFTPQGSQPLWLDFKGIILPFSRLEEQDFDIGLCSEYSILPHFEKLKAKLKFFYFILEGHKAEKEIVCKNYFFLGNSEGICRRLERKYHKTCFLAPGGVNPEIFYPLEDRNKDRNLNNEFRILCYGRIYRKRKGIQHVIRAVERLYNKFPELRLIFFDSLVGEDRRDPRPMIKTRVPYDFYLDLPQSRMAWLFSQADVFVSAEKRAGWSNTTAEAMACRLPVICTKSGTQDFAFHSQTALVVPYPHSFLLSLQIKRLIQDKALRLRLAGAGYDKIKEFTWPNLASRLEAYFQSLRN
jgi:glycosyltransferase involved in cell wall biosynthesis